MRRRRDATNAKAPSPASIPNADGSGMVESLIPVKPTKLPNVLLEPFSAFRAIFAVSPAAMVRPERTMSRSVKEPEVEPEIVLFASCPY